MEPAIAAWFRALNEGDDAALAGFAAAGGGVEAARSARTAWAAYAEEPVSTYAAGDAVAVQARFTGRTHAGLGVEQDATTLFVLERGGIAALAGWHRAPEEIAAARVLPEYFRAANAADWPAFGACWSDDAELIAVGGPARRGREDIVRVYRLFMGQFAERDDRLERLVLSGSTATAEGRFVATNPQGVPIEFEWADVVELTDDGMRIRKLSQWHDRDRFRALYAAAAEVAQRTSSPNSS